MAPRIEGKTSFVFVPNNGKGVDAASRKSMRAHAMNESLRQRLSGVKLGGSGAKVLYQLGRFRLADSATKVATKLFKLKRSPPRKHKLGTSNALQKVENTDELLKADSQTPTQLVRFTNHGIPSVPSPGRLEPFDTLPILFERRQQQILFYYETSFEQNSLSFNSDKRMVSLAAFDPAWLHGTFGIIALNMGLAQGLPGGVSLAALYHRGKALEIVSQRLRGDPAELPDTTLGAIASLANFEMTIGSLFTATAHMNGLQQLLGIRGWNKEASLPAYLGFLRQLLAWSDLCYSGLTLRRPQLKSIEPTSQLVCHSPTLIDAISADEVPLKLNDILQQLRSLSHLMDRGKLSNKEQDFFTSTVYTTQYQLVTFNGKDLFDSDNNPDLYTTNIEHHERSACLAFLVYMNMILRKIPSNSTYHSIFAQHLRSSLESSGDFLTLAWSSNLQLLFWILYIGAIATNERSERSYFVRNLALVAGDLGISDMGEFMDLLGNTVWSDNFYLPQSATVWNETSILHSAFRAQDEKGLAKLSASPEASLLLTGERSQ